MAQKSGFFNAVKQGGVYDRQYNANDYSDNLAVIIGNGVLRSENDDLRVTANGLNLSVGIGRAWINGKYYLNDSVYNFIVPTAPVSGTRIDRVVLRMDNNLSARSISLVYVQGTASASPVAPELTRTATVYELSLATITVNANASSVAVTDNREDAELCGWVFSTSGDGSFLKTKDNQFNEWFTEKKDTLASVTNVRQFVWRSVLQATTNAVQFDIPQYDADTCVLDVYVNGVLDHLGTDYTLNGNTLTFAGTLAAGTEVVVSVLKSIDGTGIDSVQDEIAELQNQVASIISAAKFNYNCTGLNDNFSLSQIAQAFYNGAYTEAEVTPAAASFLESIGGNEYLASLASDAQITVDVIGTCAVATPFEGAGSSSSPYKYFVLGANAKSDKRITFDFAKCNRLLIYCSENTNNIIFYGTDLCVKNISCQARCILTGCRIEMIASPSYDGIICFENCNFKIITTGFATISKHGDFINCNAYVSSTESHALIFIPAAAGLVRVIGGTFKAYTIGSASTSAVFYTYATDTSAVAVAYNINCPKVTNGNFVQQNLAVAYAGKTYINGVVTTLASTGNNYEIVGAIPFEKAI